MGTLIPCRFSGEGKESKMKQLVIKTLVLGMCQTNCYLVYNRDTKEGWIVDPADQAQLIVDQCGNIGMKPQAILLTHGHFDHMTAAGQVKGHFGIPVYAGEKEKGLLADSMMNLSGAWASPVTMAADVWVTKDSQLELAGCRIRVLETPGHTPGGVSYYIPQEELLFSGDTLFCESLGRTDFPGSSTSQILRSIREQLLTLPENTQVYPGHMEPTTIGHEKQYNPAAGV